MSAVLWLLVVPASALVTGFGLRAAGVPRRQAFWAAVAAGAFTAIALVALWVTALGECLGESSDADPESYPWSPRRRFCTEVGSAAALGSLAVLVLPTAAVMLGTYLRSRQRTALGWAAYAVLAATPVLPSLYVESLPSYRLDDYPVLHAPLLRPARASLPARVCYVFGIAFGPRRVRVTPRTSRHCVDLEATPEALSLTSDYDEGRTIYDLDWVGKNLTREGLPIRPGDTGVDGLVVARAYRLPEEQARAGATLVQ